MPLVSGNIENSYGALLDQIPILKNRKNIVELSGGLTNHNFMIETPEGKFVARISSNTSEFLAIDRHSEFTNSRIAAESGVGAKVFDYLHGKGVLIIGYIDGVTYTAQDVRLNLRRIAESLQRLHAGQRFDRTFNMFDIQRGYLEIVRKNNFRLPHQYLQLEPIFEKVKTALQVLDEGMVPCNNDLLPANFIDDGKKIWLIDYEYSGNNDACFELGNIWSEADLSIESLEELVTAYYGRERSEKFARAWLYAQVAKYGWVLWASIQDSISELDFDFRGWGDLKYQSLLSSVYSPLFSQMLNQVTQKS